MAKWQYNGMFPRSGGQEIYIMRACRESLWKKYFRHASTDKLIKLNYIINGLKKTCEGSVRS
jgi:hypothetical protein